MCEPPAGCCWAELWLMLPFPALTRLITQPRLTTVSRCTRSLLTHVVHARTSSPGPLLEVESAPSGVACAGCLSARAPPRCSVSALRAPSGQHLHVKRLVRQLSTRSAHPTAPPHTWTRRQRLSQAPAAAAPTLHAARCTQPTAHRPPPRSALQRCRPCAAPFCGCTSACTARTP